MLQLLGSELEKKFGPNTHTAVAGALPSPAVQCI